MNEDFNIEDGADELIETDLCPSVQMFADLIVENKPFGMNWPEETMINFLRKLGYIVVDGFSSLDGYPIKIAVKKGNTVIPDLEDSNVSSVFCEEIQSILLNWLLKIK